MTMTEFIARISDMHGGLAFVFCITLVVIIAIPLSWIVVKIITSQLGAKLLGISVLTGIAILVVLSVYDFIYMTPV